MHRIFKLALATGLLIGAAACERDTRTTTDQRLDEAQRTVEQKTDQAIDYGKDVGRDVGEGARDLGRGIEDEARELRDDLRAPAPDRSAQLPPAQDPWQNTRPGAPPMNAPEVTAEPSTAPGITSPSTSEGSADDFSSQPSVMGQTEDTQPPLTAEPEPTDQPPVTAEPSTPTEPTESTEPADQPPVTAEPSTTIEPSTPPPPSSTLDPSAPPMAAQTAPDEDVADRELQLEQQQRISTLSAVHATVASQPVVIKTSAELLALNESDRALVDEKVQELQRRIDETSTLIMSLDRVAPSNWAARNEVVDDAMRRLDASRDAAWQALHDAANHVPTSMR